MYRSTYSSSSSQISFCWWPPSAGWPIIMTLKPPGLLFSRHSVQLRLCGLAVWSWTNANLEHWQRRGVQKSGDPTQLKPSPKIGQAYQAWSQLKKNSAAHGTPLSLHQNLQGGHSSSLVLSNTQQPESEVTVARSICDNVLSMRCPSRRVVHMIL